MPLRLIAPKAGRTPNWSIRGTHLGVRVERTTGTPRKALAQAMLVRIREEIERGAFVVSGGPTFASAALTYLDAGGDDRFLAKLNNYFGDTPLADIDQAAIDKAAAAIYPDSPATTRNRQVYTPISAILKRAGIEMKVKRPKGWRGKARLHWLRPEQAIPLLKAAMTVDKRFGALCTFLTYCGVRLSEALNLTPANLDLSRAYAFVADSKNGEPQAVYLPPVVVAALAGIDLGGGSVFCLRKSSKLYKMLHEAEKLSGVILPSGISFHIFRHTYGAWMKREGVDLIHTGRWKDEASTRVYEHVDFGTEAKKAAKLPTRVKSGGRGK